MCTFFTVYIFVFFFFCIIFIMLIDCMRFTPNYLYRIFISFSFLFLIVRVYIVYAVHRCAHALNQMDIFAHYLPRTYTYYFRWLYIYIYIWVGSRCATSIKRWYFISYETQIMYSVVLNLSRFYPNIYYYRRKYFKVIVRIYILYEQKNCGEFIKNKLYLY